MDKWHPRRPNGNSKISPKSRRRQDPLDKGLNPMIESVVDGTDY